MFLGWEGINDRVAPPSLCLLNLYEHLPLFAEERPFLEEHVGIRVFFKRDRGRL